jgi:dimethylhistidine N-methyltransferase
MKYQILDSIKNSKKDTLRDQFALDVLTGFSSKPKFLASKYFYDKKGSELFQKITETQEYYPTKCEFEVFNLNKTDIVQLFPDEFSLIELGAGDGRKTRVLLQEVLKQNKKIEYLPIDISPSAVEGITEQFSEEFPQLDIWGVAGEYVEGLNWVNEHRSGPKVILFLGSNIGNFNRTQSVVFLRVMWSALSEGDILLIGADQKKDIDVMLDAYNDKEKVTNRFNLNVLTRMNNELGANFDISKFQHFGTYNPRLGAMESYIISMEDQLVNISYLKKKFSFAAFEPIHMEYSHKYSDKDIQSLADETGYELLKVFKDQKKYFGDYLLRVVKQD